MKRRINISLIAITCFSVVCPITASADSPLDKLIPRGTLLKKLKEEFGGGSNKVKAAPPQRVPTPASLVTRPDDRSRQGATQPRTPRQSQQHQSGRRPQQSQQPALATRPLPPVNHHTQTPRRNAQSLQQRTNAASALSSAAGFGAVIQMAKNNQLIVTRLQPQGNAIKAGLKPGDVVKTVGSVKLESVQEYQQITQGLKPGDQMEFEFVRRGRAQKVLVPFGTAPAVHASVTADSMPTHHAPTGSHVDSTANLDGVPSVLDGNSTQPAARVSQLTAPSVVSVPRANERRLQRTIESQRAKMERMERELEMLRKTNAPAISPTENNWALPELTAPN